MARQKMWWQSKEEEVKPWIIDPRRDPCDCSQGFKLAVSGYSEKQGPTHYCPCCRWGFWPVIMKPTAAQVKEIQKTHPDLKEADLTYTKLRNKPAATWGGSPETVMIDHLGGKLPTFLTVALRRYWNKKWCEKYPNTERGKAYRQKIMDEQKKKS